MNTKKWRFQPVKSASHSLLADIIFGCNDNFSSILCVNGKRHGKKIWELYCKT